MEKIKAGKKVRVNVENQPSFTGTVTMAAECENIFTKKDFMEYHVQADDDGHTYKVVVGKEGCTGIQEI